MFSYSYVKQINIETLTTAIRADKAITAALDSITTVGTNFVCVFRSALGSSEKAALDAVVSAHVFSVPAVIATPMVIVEQPPFGAKTINGKKIFKRVMGTSKVVTAGETNIDYIIPFDWAKITGLEIVNCACMDKIALQVIDSATGTVSSTPGLLLNQFGTKVNMPHGFYEHRSEFDADLYKGLILRVIYESKTEKEVGVNFILNEVK